MEKAIIKGAHTKVIGSSRYLAMKCPKTRNYLFFIEVMIINGDSCDRNIKILIRLKVPYVVVT